MISIHLLIFLSETQNIDIQITTESKKHNINLNTKIYDNYRTMSEQKIILQSLRKQD